MAQPIPPLLCNTPPPIDFDDGNDDDFGDFEGARTDYEGSLSASPGHEVKNVEESLELPPLPNDVEYSLYTAINPSPVLEAVELTSPELPDFKNPPDSRISEIGEAVLNLEEQREESLKGKCGSDGELETELNAIKLSETQIIITSDTKINRSELKTERLEKLSREDSPQSLDLCTANLSDDEDDSIGEFQVASEAKYDDNTSLPSLKFDSITVSKSTTPIFDEKVNESKEQVDTFRNKDSTSSALPSLTSSQTNLEDKQEEINAIEAVDDNLEVSQDKPEELFTEFQQSNIKEEADESKSTTVSAASITNKESILNETSDHTIIDDLQYCQFNDFTLDNDVSAEEKTSIFSVENISKENLSSTEDNVVDNFSGFTFEADFSQFESVDDEKVVLGSEPEKLLKNDAPTILPESFENDIIAGDDDDFEDFQDFTTTKVETADDFGEFSEFDTINPDSDRRGSFKLRNVDGKVKPILDLMFPEEPEGSEACYDSKDNSRQNSQNSSSQLTTNLQEIDTAKALDYQWANSNVKHSLIKALGIDSRNILYGEKWNSSVPRFAANLVFNPLEPLRPVKIGGHSSTCISSANQETRHAESSAPPKGNVPEVEFDWNSSGLVNPLDGVKEIVCERKTEAIHSSQSGSINESIEQQAAEKAIITQNNPTNTAANLPNINNDLTNESFTMQNFTNGEEHIMHQIIKPGCDETHSSSTPTAFVFPLKETHIYTPSKLDSVSRHIKTEDKDPIDFDYKTAAAGIIIDEKVVKKEYRDVEYNPTNWNLGPLEEKYINNSNGSNTCTSSNFEPSVDILSSNFSSLTEKSDDDSKNTKVKNFSEDFSSFQYNLTRSDPNLKNKEIIQNPHEANGDNFEPIMQITNEACIGKNDSELDDDFSDFQSVPPPVINPIKMNNQMFKTAIEEKAKSRTGTPTLSDEMILSPAVLLPQAIKLECGPKIDWPEPGINPEELARIEELFPQSKKNTMSENKAPTTAISTNDDDDWSDFVSVPVANQSNLPQMQAPLGSKSTAKMVGSPSNDDEWSDFVSSAPVQWNNPVLLPQYNAWSHHTTKNTLINPHVSSQPNIQLQHKNNVPTNFYRGNNVNNNISQYLLHSNSVMADHRPNHFLPQQQEQIFHNTAPYQNQLQQDQTTLKSQLNQTPSISLIPDLGFVAPRNLINIPRSAISKK